MCVQPTWSTCSLSSTSTTSTSRRLLSEFTQEHLANRRKLLADPSDKDSIVAAKESLQGVHPVGYASLHMQATASVHPFWLCIIAVAGYCKCAPFWLCIIAFAGYCKWCITAECH